MKKLLLLFLILLCTNLVFALNITNTTYFNPSLSNVTYHFSDNVSVDKINITSTSLIINDTVNITIISNETINVSIMGVRSGYHKLIEVNNAENFTLVINARNDIDVLFGNYTLHADNTPPTVTLSAPPNDHETLDDMPKFNFTCVDTYTTTLNATLVINGSMYGDNLTCANNTVCSITANTTLNYYDRVYNWSVNCTDVGSNVGSSSGRNLRLLETEIVSETTTGGGGGSPTQKEELAYEEEFAAAVSLCEQQLGEPVNIKGVIYCKLNDTYIPIEGMLEPKEGVKIFGWLMPNFGKLLYPSNQYLGWGMIIIIIIGLVYATAPIRELKIEKEAAKIPKKQKEKEMKEYESRDRRKRRSDGGFY